MAVSPSVLAAAMSTGIGQSTVTPQLLGLATGILNELTISGHAAVGHPSGNLISGMSGSSMASRVATDAGYGSVSTQLLHFCTGITTHILTSGTVSYTGPVPPAPIVYFLGGTIHGLSGSAMAALVAADVGYPFVSSQLLGLCDAVATHIMANATVTSGVIS